MWNRLAAAALAATLLLSLSARARAQAAEAPLDGREVMRRVDARAQGTDQVARARWRLVAKGGYERVRDTRTFWSDQRGQPGDLRSKRLIVFTAPHAIADTAFLVWSQRQPLADDLRWIYLPALRKTRRIAGRDRGTTFMGTDFLYEDLSDREVDADEHRLLETTPSPTGPVYVVESIPHDEGSTYSRRVVRVDGSRWVITGVEYYARSGLHLKTLAIDWQQVQGFWTWKRLLMQNHRSGHSTQVDVEDAAWNVGLDDSLFAQNALSRAARSLPAAPGG